MPFSEAGLVLADAVRPLLAQTFTHAMDIRKDLAAAIPEFNRICTDVARMLVREESMNHREIAQKLGQPTFLIEHVFRLLESNSLIKYAESGGGGLHLDVLWVSPELKRKLEQS